MVYDGLFIFSSSVKELNVGIRKTRRFYAWWTQCLQVFRFLYFERPKLKVEQHSQRKWLPCHTLTFHLRIRKLQPPGRGLKSLNSNSTKKGIAKCSTPLNNWVTRPHPWFFHSKNSKHAMPTDVLVLKGPLHEVVSVSRVHHVAFRPYLVKIMFVLREEQRIFGRK